MKRKFFKIISIFSMFFFFVILFGSDGKPISYKEIFQKQKEIGEKILEIQNQLSKDEIDPKLGKTRAELQIELENLNRQILELNIQLTQPDTTSQNWKPLGPDIGLMVFQDRHGRVRGTLYVKYGDYWQSIAIDSVEELGPFVIPGTKN